MIKKVTAVVAFALSFFNAQAVLAEVNPRNGNYAITYQLSSEHQRITYNSKSTDRGWFGFGWGSVFETRLLVMTDGSAVVLENGTGMQTTYGSKSGPNPEQQLVQQMLGDILATDKLDPFQIEDLRRQLASPDDRINKLKAYGMSGKVALGTTLKGQGCETAQLVKVADGYQRHTCAGARDDFDQRGWLVRRTSADGQVSSAVYDNSPYPKEIIESDGRRIFLQWNNRGQMTTQGHTDKNGKEVKVLLHYDQKGNLARLDHVGGNFDQLSNRFTYDARQNLVEVRYNDESTIQIAYDNADQAVAVTNRSGQQTRYEYSTNSKTREDTTIIISKENDGSEKRRTLRYASDGQPTRTEDAQGRWTEFAYHPEFRKVTLMRTAATERRFEYDSKGNVISVTDSQSGGSARFAYDKQGRIAKLVSGSPQSPSKVLTFSYNANNKPIKIVLEGVGQIDVRYSSDGEIEAVNSPAGARIALSVTQAFQSMLSLVKMSGVSLGL